MRAKVVGRLAKVEALVLFANVANHKRRVLQNVDSRVAYYCSVVNWRRDEMVHDLNLRRRRGKTILDRRKLVRRRPVRLLAARVGRLLRDANLPPEEEADEDES